MPKQKQWMKPHQHRCWCGKHWTHLDPNCNAEPVIDCAHCRAGLAVSPIAQTVTETKPVALVV